MGAPSPASSMEKLPHHGGRILCQRRKMRVALCEWLRMKFSAGFLQWKPSEASRGYES